jgi:hypothetical protein
MFFLYTFAERIKNSREFTIMPVNNLRREKTKGIANIKKERTIVFRKTKFVSKETVFWFLI